MYIRKLLYFFLHQPWKSEITIPLCRVIVRQALTATPRFEQLEKQIYYVHLMSRQSLQLPYPITRRFSLPKCWDIAPTPNPVQLGNPLTRHAFSGRQRWIRGGLTHITDVLSFSFTLSLTLSLFLFFFLWHLMLSLLTSSHKCLKLFSKRIILNSRLRMRQRTEKTLKCRMRNLDIFLFF